MEKSKSPSFYRHKQSCICLILFLLATTSLIRAVASEQPVPTDHTLTVTVPDGWELRKGSKAPVLVTAVEPKTGNSFGLLGFKQPDAKFVLNRKSAEDGITEELSPTGKILRRMDTKLAGVSAYCVIVEVQIEGRKFSIARIMAEKPLNGFVYALQYSKMGGGDIDDATVQAMAGRVKVKRN